MSPTARSLAYLRAQGALAQVVERWVPQARRRIDLFRCIDLVAIRVVDEDGVPLSGVLGVQATSATNMASRLKKMRSGAAEYVYEWLVASNRLEIHGWGLKGARGKRKTWQVTVRTITLADLDSEG